jgi:hypothetical protein
MTENIEFIENYSEKSNLSKCSVMTKVQEAQLLPSEVEQIEEFTKAIEKSIKVHANTTKLKLTKDLTNDQQMYERRFQLYDNDNVLLMTSAEYLSISVMRDKYYKETIEEMIKEDFKNLVILDNE